MEVATVKGRDGGDGEAFADRDQAGVGASEREVSVDFDEFGDAQVVARGERFDEDVPVGDRAVETGLGGWAGLPIDQVSGFVDDQRGGDESVGRGLDQINTRGVGRVGVIGSTE